MRFKAAKFLVFVGVLFVSVSGYSGTKTDKQVFNEMLTLGVPVGQAVFGVLANSPNSASAIVQSALAAAPDSVFSITLAALNAAPAKHVGIIKVIVDNSSDSNAIISAVAEHDLKKVSQAVQVLISKDINRKDTFIGQAADALIKVQVVNNPELGADAIRNAL